MRMNVMNHAWRLWVITKAKEAKLVVTGEEGDKIGQSGRSRSDEEDL